MQSNRKEKALLHFIGLFLLNFIRIGKQFCFGINDTSLKRGRFISGLAFVLLLAINSHTAFAVQVKGLYLAQVPVVNQGREQRRQALITALKSVLVKVSGGRSVLDNIALMKSINRPERWLQQYSYHATLPSTPALETPVVNAPTPQPGYELSATFSRKGINQLLQQNKEAIWGSNRPSVLIWLAVSESGIRTLEAAGKKPWSSWIQDAAAKRGLPVFLPTMDLQDQAAMNSSDVWGLFMDPVAKASIRYGADVVVAANAYPLSDGSWKGAWASRGQGFQQSGDLAGVTPEALAKDLINRIADDLAERFALRDELSGKTALLMNVRGVNSFSSFLALEQYLNSLDLVTNVTPIRILVGEVDLRLQLGGDVDQLQKYFNLDHYLVPDEVPVKEAGNSFQFHYLWTKKLLKP